MKDVFTGSNGLFPSPEEISFDCSCPDFANLCKHTSAVLYGIGARFDEDPLLFFTLRGVDTSDFIDVVINKRIESMLINYGAPNDRIIDDADLNSIFGIPDIE